MRRNTAQSLPRVLVADDNANNIEIVRAILASIGLTAVSASDGHRAVALATSARFDLILMDIEMPVMDGLSAIRAIRKAERASGDPAGFIYTLTTRCAPEDICASRAAGADGHLTKPIQVPELIGVIAPILSSLAFSPR